MPAPSNLADDTFTCENCGGTFIKGRSYEEADAEARELWGDIPADDTVVLCDDCFEAFMAWMAKHHPGAIKKKK